MNMNVSCIYAFYCRFLVNITFIVGIIKVNLRLMSAAVGLRLQWILKADCAALSSLLLSAPSSKSGHCLPVFECAYYYASRSALVYVKGGKKNISEEQRRLLKSESLRFAG